MANDAFQSLKGQLLLDGGKLQGSYFHRTVLLICEHNEQGAMGLVLNRKTENEIGEVIQADIPESIETIALYSGGPVQPSALSFLHSNDLLLNPNVMDHLSVGHSLENLVELGESFAPSHHIKVFAGYAGWSPGQLEDEMKRDAWLTHPASLDLVFFHPPEHLWSHILTIKGGLFRLLSQAPDDLSWN